MSSLRTNAAGQFVVGPGEDLQFSVDKVLESFHDLSMDGDLLLLDEDYSAVSGSTVITITAQRLSLFAAGVHTLAAEFDDETIEIVFLLDIATGHEALVVQPSPAPIPDVKPVAPVEPQTTAPWVAVMVTAVFLAAAGVVATVTWRIKHGKKVEKT